MITPITHQASTTPASVLVHAAHPPLQGHRIRRSDQLQDGGGARNEERDGTNTKHPTSPPARRRDRRRQCAQWRASLATCSACMARAASTQQLAPLPARAGHCSARRRMSSPVLPSRRAPPPAPTPEREGIATAAGAPRLVIGMAVADGQKRNLSIFEILAHRYTCDTHMTHDI